MIFIYTKDEKIKCLPLDEAKEQSLDKKGYVHTATLDPCAFLEYLHNVADEDDVHTSINSLSLKYK